MSNTIPDIDLNTDAYQDVYTLTGIASGTALVLQNKSGNHADIIIAASQPPKKSTGSVAFFPDPRVVANIAEGESGVWMKGDGLISVQEA